MTAEAVRDAVGELYLWLPAAEALITVPDVQGSAGRGQPSSRPPWNQAAADALLDAAEGARQLEALWRSEAARRPVTVRPMSHTGDTLASLVRLSWALPDCPPRETGENGKPQPCRCERCEALRSISRWTTRIWQLRAVDRAERPKVIPGSCPYCIARDEGMRGRCMLVVFERSGRVRCFFAGQPCTDGDGMPPAGVLGRSALDGSACIAWSDGLVT